MIECSHTGIHLEGEAIPLAEEFLNFLFRQRSLRKIPDKGVFQDVPFEAAVSKIPHLFNPCTDIVNYRLIIKHLSSSISGVSELKGLYENP